ncbi:MAG: hypothetical protein EOO55_01270 [Hymenobacter sp.]|nr:MAG: hypothetical protein EOO55_01270 [Hymenobacter sp.]
MSLFYQIVFPQDAPEAETFIQRQLVEWAVTFQLEKESPTQFIVLQQAEVVLALIVTHESNYVELSFGEYAYTTDWYIELGKSDGLTAMKFYVALLGSVITSYKGDFLSLFNGERVVAKRENGHLYLNTESSIWQKDSNLALLANQPYELATYPVE